MGYLLWQSKHTYQVLITAGIFKALLVGRALSMERDIIDTITDNSEIFLHKLL